MLDAAERFPLPARFILKYGDRPSRVIILDNETGRQSTVGLYALSQVLQTLNDLFGC
jgi:hypothetical protein